MSKTPRKKSLLLEAHETINGARQKQYGDPSVAMKAVADQWQLYLLQKFGVCVPIRGIDVCWMMADLKKTREFAAHKRDNALDAAGYIGLTDLIDDREG